MIELVNVTKIYKNRKPFGRGRGTIGVEELDLEIDSGVFGLLGVNGAGKTTTLKMVATLLYPSSGSVVIDGLDVRVHEKRLRRRINMITGSDRMLYFRLTGRENLLYFASLYGMPRRDAKRRCDYLMDLTGIKSAADKRVEQYSRGMKQRLAIARGLINDPSILLLDEPTLGLDVSIAAGIRSFIKELLGNDRQRTVILTSHYMSEIEELCREIGILQDGRLIYNGGFDGLYRQMELHEVHRFSIPAEQGHRKKDIDRISGGSASWSTEADGRIVFELKAEAGFGFLKRIDDLGLSGLSYSQQKPGLGEAIIKLTAGA